jgi:hypothetical protein
MKLQANHSNESLDRLAISHKHESKSKAEAECLGMTELEDEPFRQRKNSGVEARVDIITFGVSKYKNTR